MRLTDCFIELVAYVAYFLDTIDRVQQPFEQVKSDIQALISKSQRLMEEGSFSKEDYDLARFAIFAWIDEAILSSNWSDKHRWQAEQLQRLYYQTTDAGEIFFEKLNNLGPHQRDVREVYYLCLAMGFTGRYCHEGDEYLLDQLKISNLKILTGRSTGVPSLDNTELFPEAYPVESASTDSLPSDRFFSPFVLLCVTLPVSLLCFMFIVYRFILSNIGENLLKMVQ